MTGGAPAPPHGPPAPAALGALIALLEARCGLLSQPIERAAIDAAAQAALREAGAVPAAPPPALRGGNAAAAAGASTGTPSCGVSSCSTAATPPRAGAAASQDPAGCPDAAAAPPLLRMLQHHGWAGRSFAGPLDARRLASRLKAFLYEGLRPCGSGSYSVVYHARCKLTGAPVVLKRVRLEGGAEGLPSTALREASLLRQLAASPHVVQLREVLWDRSRLYLVLESLDCDLKEQLDRDPAARTLPRVKSAMYQILSGLAHAHAHRVMHRDLKPQNCLVDRCSGVVKLADFGLARTFAPAGRDPSRPYTHEVQTLLYRAPEVLLGLGAYTPAIDAWSAGCVLAELATGRPLFLGDSEFGQLLAIFRLLGTPSEGAWPGLADLPDWSPAFPQWRPHDLAEAVPQLDTLGLDLLAQLLRYAPAQRISCRRALAHPWFDEVRAAEEARGRAAQQAAAGAQAALEQRWQAAAAAAAALCAAVSRREPAEPLATPVAGTAHLLACEGQSPSDAAPQSQASAQTRGSLRGEASADKRPPQT